MIIKDLAKVCTETIEQSSFTRAYHSTFKLYHCTTELLKEQTYRMRSSIYCREYSYESPISTDSYIERDKYDSRAEHFLLRHRVSNELVSSLRVILPNKEKLCESFPMQEICSHTLFEDDNRIQKLCEISRFCVAPRFRQRSSDGQFLSSYYEQDKAGRKSGNISFIRRKISYPQAALLQGAFEVALNAEILDCLWMVELAHLPSLDALGFDYHILGSKVDIYGGMQPLVFNIKHVLDSMQYNSPACWEIISDFGRLQQMANELSKNDWQANLVNS